jgi:ADP-ribose pyrophosphatase YjhB (NUDIX family)
MTSSGPYLDPKSAVIVSGVVICNGQMLLVRQPGPAGPGTVWALPGGRVEPGELVAEAIVREIHEETGADASLVRLLSVGQLANPTNIRRDSGEVPEPGQVATVFVFLLEASPGELSGSADPDAEIDEVDTVSLAEGMSRLDQHPFPFMRRLTTDGVASVRDHRSAVHVISFRRDERGIDRELVKDYGSEILV